MTFSTRPIKPDEWEVLREIRLRALKSCPSVFSSSYARESAYSEADWRDWLSQDGKCVFGLFDGDKVIGLTGIITMAEDAATAVLVASFIDDAYRGKGLAKLLYRARLEWAAQQSGFSRVIVSHRASNEASRRANQAWGFVQTHREPHTWPDGAQEDQIHYELKVGDIKL